MKTLFLSLLFALNIFACELVAPKIVEYDACHKEAIIAMALQDPHSIFSGGHAVAQGLMSEEAFLSEGQKALTGILEDPVQVKKVLTVGDKIAGFSQVSKSKEQSLETLIRTILKSGVKCNVRQVADTYSHMKKTDKECSEFGHIGALLVSREFRKRGFGRMLLQDAFQEIVRRWPLFLPARLNVNADNLVAIKLYESEGYKKSEIQPPLSVLMKEIEYQKSL